MTGLDWRLPYPSRREPVLAANLVATSQPLAVRAGLWALERGGNAVDAALTAAITLVVVEPTGNGLGSDAFAQVWDGRSLLGINGSGRSPAALDAARFAGEQKMPLLGWDAVTVPGAVSVWVELSARYGRLPFADLFTPAVRYARDGFLVAPRTAELWGQVAPLYAGSAEFERVFLPEGRPPRAGERFRAPELAASLEAVAESTGNAFYDGRLAQQIAEHARTAGAALTAEDLSTHRVDWVEPLAVDYRGWSLHELPPNGQGLAALIALGTLAHWPLADAPVDSADSLHLQIEATKQALSEARRHVADPRATKTRPEQLLAADSMHARSRRIDPRRATLPAPTQAGAGDTVYLTTADASGMMVSFIQSNYLAFGSGVVVPGTGISLQNRGACFTLEAGHPNCVGPGKRPFHTIIPAFVSRQGRPVMSFGVMGGDMQPQGHVQVMVRIVDYGQNPQAAIDAPRWQVLGGLDVAVEAGFEPSVLAELERRGHRIQRLDPMWFGGAQAIYRLAEGYLGASDPRKDGQAAGF